MALSWPPSVRVPKKLLLTAAGVVAVLGGMMFLGSQVQQLKAQLFQGQQKIAELSSRNQELTQRLEALQGERRDLDSRVSSLSQQLASASAELEQASVGFQDLQHRVQRMGEEKAALQSRVDSLTDERRMNQERLEQLAKEKTDLEHSAIRLRERLSFLDRDYQKIAAKLAELEQTTAQPKEVVAVEGRAFDSPPSSAAQPLASAAVADASQRGTVELPPIIVRKDQPGTTMPVRGRLVEVNEPHRFVILDKGSVDGVRVGMGFDIIRGAGNVIGRATATRVRQQLAACDVMSAQTSQPLQVGDTAVQSTP